MAELHIGEKIKARALELSIGPTELARRINTSKQNVYGIYHRKSIDTELLQKISIALEFDFFVYYQAKVHDQSSQWEDKKPDYKKRASNASAIRKLMEKFIKLEKEVKLLKKEHEELKSKVN